MDVILKLNPEVEKGLLARAQERGVSLTAYLQEVVTRESAVPTQAVSKPERRHISEVVRQRMSEVPAEMMATLPSDGASQHDHYLYGSAKREK